MHGNLKPENILINKDKKVILSDAGIGYGLNGKFNLLNNESMMQSRYLEKIALSNSSITLERDIWSCGVIFLELVLGRSSLTNAQIDELGPDKVVHMLSNIKAYSKEMVQFISRCFIKIPSSRPKVKDLMADQWFSKTIFLNRQLI